MQIHSASLPAYLATIVSYKDLVSQLVRREFSTRYRGSMLGVLWAVVNPILTVLIFSFLFEIIFKARWGSEPNSPGDFAIIALVGMVVHGIFAESLGQAPNVILGRSSYVKRVVFPLEILPIVTVATALLNAAAAMTVVLAAYAILNGGIPLTVLLLPLVLVPFIFLVGGVVLFVSAVGVYLRDLSQIVNFLTMATLFLAPVFYPVSAVPENYRFLLYLNPLTFTIEQAREVALFGHLPDWSGLTIYSVIAFAFAWAGFWWFQRARKGFADVI
jgi:lipopolysaccharide transport system permease protein